MLYSEKYRKDTGGEYTPTCFVELQNKILNENYNLDEYIVFDPCAGVGNLENQFGKDFKQYCYLSTLEKTDVDICKIKGFENSLRFDYLKSDEQPKFKYKGSILDITDICKREKRKLMVVMNPPYKGKVKGHKYDLAIDFFRKVLFLEPDVIVYYCKTEFFFRDTIDVFFNSNYKIISHSFSTAKDTFKLSDWMISQVILDKINGKQILKDSINVERYDYNKKKDTLDYFNEYTYENGRPSLIKDIECKIKTNQTGLILGQWTNQNYCLVLSNRTDHKDKAITSNNITYSLLLKGINFNTHAKYFETSNLTYKGTFEDISTELQTDCIMFSLFYTGINFTNKGPKNYIMPFTAQELGCNRNDLNVLYTDELQNDIFNQGQYFDFREFLQQFTFSKEAKNLYIAALQVFKYYHSNQEYIHGRDWNDSYYDITNAIMGKDVSNFSTIDSKKDKRITKVKTTKGTKGFGRNTIKYVVSSEYLPIFENFFDKRDILAKKINRQLVEQKLLLWERENIF